MNLKLLYELDKELVKEKNITLFFPIGNYYASERYGALMYFWSNLFPSIPKVVEWNDTINEEVDKAYHEHNIDTSKLKQIDGDKTLTKFERENNYIKVGDVIFGDECIVYQNILIYNKKETIDKLLNSIVFTKQEGYIGYAIKTTYGISTSKLNSNLRLPFIPENYNDDIPNEQIKNIINYEDNGIIILYGLPGTGKTHYIQSLFYSLADRNFIMLSSELLLQMSYTDCLSFFEEFHDSIFIIEDCEDIIVASKQRSSALTSILNLSDGIIGRNSHPKFILTFNTNINNIDPALLRKGRLKYKYEFKNLTADKAVALGNKLGIDIPHKEMSLCDIYNYDMHIGTQVRKKIGF